MRSRLCRAAVFCGKRGDAMDFSPEKYQTLKNGARLVSFRAPQLNTVAFSVVLPFVPEATPGVYHLVEHMFFERAGERRAAEINAEMTSRGSEINGYTAVNYMCFSFCCRREVFLPQLRLLHSMLTQTDYEREDFDRVLPVIRNEIFENAFYDGRAGDILRELWFDSRYINSILGSWHVLEGLDIAEVNEVRAKLLSKEMCLFLAGAFSEEDERAVEQTFGEISLCPLERTPARKEEKETREYNKCGRGRELQVLVTYHVERASKELKLAAHWLRSGLFDGLDAAFFRFFDEKGFQFYSVDGNYAVRGDELVFSYLMHIEKKDKRAIEYLIDEFEEAAEKTDFLSLVKPYLYDNLVFLFDNPERLCAHYVDAWADLSAPLTLREEAEIGAKFTNEALAKCWRKIYTSLRRIFFIGR